MSKSESAESSPYFEGKMFLYDNPVLLNKEEHAGMGLSTPARPYDFVKDIRGIPVVTNEIQTVQKHYPVVFSEFENPVLIAVLGILDDKNLFVSDDGEWTRDAYIPSYVRCHPIAFVRREEEEYAIIIDESSKAISKTPEFPFFEGEKLSEHMQSRVDFCGALNQHREITKTFCDRVKELGLLNGQRVAQTMPDGTEVKVADYVTIDSKKLNDLDKDTLQELHEDGSLAAIFALLFSLENWNRLIARRNEQLAAD
jgi:hypothetical protein